VSFFAPSSRILLTTTPYGENWFLKLKQNAEQPSSEYSWHHWRTIDNPYANKEEYYARKADWPAWMFNMYYNGEMGRPENACFPEFGDAQCVDTVYDNTLPIYVGSDFNSGRQPMHWTLCHYKNNQLHVYDEIYLPAGTNPKTTTMLDELWNRHSTHKSGFIFCGDATGKAEHSVMTSDT
jgi:hypothetical protein